MVLVSWAHARINWSIRLHLRLFLRKDERENNANVLDIYSSGASERAGKLQYNIHEKVTQFWLAEKGVQFFCNTSANL